MRRMRRSVMICLLVGLFAAVAGAQTPTPTPPQLVGTPVALTCVDVGQSVSSAQAQLSWRYLDRAAVVLEPADPTSAVQIRSVMAMFGEGTKPLAIQLRIWEITNEQYLPDINAACSLVGGPFGFGQAATANELNWVLMDIVGQYPSADPIIINPGKKFIVDIENQMDYQPPLDEGMKIAAEAVGQCPPFFFTNETNILFDYDGLNSEWYFREDVVPVPTPPTNYLIYAGYTDGATARVPAMSWFGIAVLFVFITGLITRRKH